MSKITAEMVRKAKWKAQAFLSFNDGGYRHQYVCETYPRLTHAKWADKRSGPYFRGFWVDGEKVEGAEAIADALNREPDASSRSTEA
jgi:hypothetical protein